MALSATDSTDARRFAGYPSRAACAAAGGVLAASSTVFDFLLTQFTPEEELYVVGTQLPQLRLLEADVPEMRDNLDLKKAAVYERNLNEMNERETLFLAMRKRFCAVIGATPGPGLTVEVISPDGGSNNVPAIFIV